VTTRKKNPEPLEHLELGPGKEFDVVRALLAEWGESASGIGDDAAVLELPPGEKLVVTTDTSVEGVHFKREWLDHSEIGYRATAAALSDLAAMAARPLGIVIALTLSRSGPNEITALAKGILEAASGSGCAIVGGDLTRGDALSLTITAFGSAVRPLSRSGAQPGDRLYVTGSLGGPGAALRAWLAGTKPSAPDRARFAHPIPRIQAALALAARGASAGIDISDGLAADLAHLAAASAVRIEVDLERLPRVSGVSAVEAATSGEEYELAVTAPDIDVRAFSTELGVPLAEIGRIVAGAQGVEMRESGKKVATPAGYDHFNRK
jgi:thiamine-monophosphate kinase